MRGRALAELVLGAARGRLARGELLVRVSVPLARPAVLRMFKHARRKTGDLAIANMAVSCEVAGPGHLASPQVYIGGVGLAVAECPRRAVLRAGHLETLLAGQGTSEISRQDICDAVEKDLKIETDVSHLENIQFKKSLVVGFVLKFLDGVWRPGAGAEQLPPLEFTQLHETTSADQPPMDPVTRPVPHASSAEQCAGEAVFVADMPRYEREVALVPVQSSQPHARIRGVDTAAALAMPGVVAWIAAADVPGSNLWGIGVADEELFPTETVLYVGQIIGLIAADNPDIGAAAAAAVRVEYEPLPPILTLSEAAAAHSTLCDPIVVKKDNRQRNKVEGVTSVGKVTGTVLLGGQEHFYWEPHTALAVPVQEKQEITVHCGVQGPSGLQEKLASVLGIPQHRVSVKVRYDLKHQMK